MPIRKIIHIDMDAFFASVEQRDNPLLKGRPVAVGGNRSRGVVAAASYEARKYGVHSALPSVIAYRRCPEIIFIKPRFEVYQSVSRQLLKVFEEYTDLVEPLSLDEAYLDVTENKIGLPSASLIAKAIKQKIYDETHLTCSAGISINKFLAKTASDINKPDGLTLIRPEDAEDFVEKIKVEKIFGVGNVTAKKMRRMGILTGKDLKSKNLPFLTKNFGKQGIYFFNISRAIDDRPVNPDRIRKSVSVENTFNTDLETWDEVRNATVELCQELERRLSKSSIKGRTVVLKIKYHDFTQLTRSKTSSRWMGKVEDFWPLVEGILTEDQLISKSIRLLGVGLTSLNTERNKTALQLTIDF